MNKIKGIYAASLSILDKNLSLNVNKTIQHAETLIDNGCHGVVLFGSTGQAQLISVSEKVQLINSLVKSKYKSKYIIGTGFNSLIETINFMKVSNSLNFKKYLIMPPAYYKYGDEEVVNYYSKIIEQINDCKIILYNFEKLCGYKFSKECVEKLVNKFPQQIVGVKDSSYNLFKELKIKNFSVLPGSESKLFDGLKIGCSGIITATCNVTAQLSRKVYDDFINNKSQTTNSKLCNVRKVFEQFNLISGLHSFFGQKDESFNNLIPTLSPLSEKDKKKLFEDLEKLDFNINNQKVS